MTSPFWQKHAETIDLDRFRASPQFLDCAGYDYGAVLADIQSSATSSKLLGALDEDGAFGCETVEIDGRIVSRDLLDSVTELAFLRDMIGPAVERMTVLDIGAGYGRLAHRMRSAWPNTHYICTDFVFLSTLACEKYIQFRGLAKCEVWRPETLDLVPRPIDLAVNVHCWSECTADEVDHWITWLAARRVPLLYIVPHNPTLGVWDDAKGGGCGPSYRPLLERARYREFRRWRGPESRTHFLFELEETR